MFIVSRVLFLSIQKMTCLNVSLENKDGTAILVNLHKINCVLFLDLT